jgi:acetyltransferase EpsM
MDSSEKVVILGIGSYSVNIAEIINAMNEANSDDKDYRKKEIIGFVDPETKKTGRKFFEFEVLGDFTWFNDINENISVVGIINRDERYEIINKISRHPYLKFPNIVHPSTTVSSKANIGFGNIIAQGVIISPEANIGNFNKLNYGVIIGHHCNIGNFNIINGMAHITGSSTIGNYCMLGAASIIIDNVTVGDKVKVGANSLVRKDLPNGVTAVGSPAKIL